MLVSVSQRRQTFREEISRFNRSRKPSPYAKQYEKELLSEQRSMLPNHKAMCTEIPYDNNAALATPTCSRNFHVLHEEISRFNRIRKPSPYAKQHETELLSEQRSMLPNHKTMCTVSHYDNNAASSTPACYRNSRVLQEEIKASRMHM